MLKKLLTVLSVVTMVRQANALQNVRNVKELYDAVIEGPNRKVGFLSAGNFEAVKTILPDVVEPVYYKGTEDIVADIASDKILAGLISGIPPNRDNTLNIFSSRLMSTRAFLFNNVNDASDLIDLIDASIVRLTKSGKDQQFARNNPPFELTNVHTCHPEPDRYPIPTAASASGTLASVVSSGVLKIAALGPFNWEQDGDYTKNPPVGFYPDYLNEIMNIINANGYTLELQRVWFNTSQGVLDAVKAGTAHATEPYFTVDSFYNGRSRKREFSESCLVMGDESNFFSKHYPDSPALSDPEIAGIVVSIVVALAGIIIVPILIYRERAGRPVFKPLVSENRAKVQGPKETAEVECSGL